VFKDVQQLKLNHKLAIKGDNHLKKSSKIKDMRTKINQVDLVQEFKLASAFGQKSESGCGKAYSNNFS